MSILDAGPHAVTVYPEILAYDRNDNPVKQPAKTGTVVTGCTITPLGTSRGQRDASAHADYRIAARTAPIGPWSRIEWQGRNFFILDGPHRFNASPETMHVSAVIREEL